MKLGVAADVLDADGHLEVVADLAERVETAAGQFATRTFLVNVRDSRLSPGNAVKLDVLLAGRAGQAVAGDGRRRGGCVSR